MTNLSQTYLNRGDVIEFQSYEADNNQTQRLNSLREYRQPVSAMVVSVVMDKCPCCGSPKASKVHVFIAEHNATEEIDGRINFRILARK